jgi:hypothetical protein
MCCRVALDEAVCKVEEIWRARSCEYLPGLRSGRRRTDGSHLRA